MAITEMTGVNVTYEQCTLSSNLHAWFYTQYYCLMFTQLET